MKKLYIALTSVAVLSGFAITAQATTDSSALYSNAKASGLNADVLHKALNAYSWAKTHDKVSNPNVLTVIDYSLPSTEKRLWVLDLKSNKVLMNTLVAHGHNSGDVYANQFSNSPESRKTSLGVYTTADLPFYGKHGRALKVYGLEQGINSNAYNRAIEIHGAQYVSDSAASNGRIGRTFGCFGMSPDKVQTMISYTQGGSVLFAYAAPENKDPVAVEG